MDPHELTQDPPEGTYEQAREALVLKLRRAADAHEDGRIKDVEDGFEAFDAMLPRDATPQFDKLHTGLVFWDSWIDAAEHAWQFYEPIEQDDWPRLARLIADAVEADQDITDPLVIEMFDLRRKKKSAFQRMLEMVWPGRGGEQLR